ncbi:hypothetical protein GCM10020295_16330 [Streptomyces cinereospinus]
MSRTLVVVGHGMVAHRLVERLLDGDTRRQWRVVVLGEEPWPAYDRIHLSRHLEGAGTDALLLTDPARGRAAGWRRGPAPGRWAWTASGAWYGPSRASPTGTTPWSWPPGHGRSCRRCPAGTPKAASPTARWTTSGRSGPPRRPAPPPVVVGGGLLGLEAANGLRALGMRTHVVEAAPG